MPRPHKPEETSGKPRQVEIVLAQAGRCRMRGVGSTAKALHAGQNQAPNTLKTQTVEPSCSLRLS